MSGALTFAWRCYARGDASRTCFTRGDEPGNQRRLVLAPNALLPDRYTIELTVSRGAASSTAVTHVRVVPDDVPRVAVLTSGGAPRPT